MSRPTIRPSGIERTFADDEIIVSKTDTKGIITYANKVFLDIAKYREDQVLGQPHNMIRHPDMPRSVFQLLWDVIESGEEIFAYVVNLAADGAHYWVLAHVTPTFDANGKIVGYHSNRRTPRKEALAAIEPVYAALRKAEQAESGAKAQVAAGVALLTKTLEDAGMTYDEWVWSLENEAGEDAA